MDIQDLKQDIRNLTSKADDAQRRLDQLSFKLEMSTQKTDMEIAKYRDSLEKLIRDFEKHSNYDRDGKEKINITASKIQDSIEDVLDAVKNLSKKLEQEIDSIARVDEIQAQQIADGLASVHSLKEIVLMQKREIDEMKTKETTTQDTTNWKVWLSTNKMIATFLVALAAGATTIISFWDKVQKILGE